MLNSIANLLQRVAAAMAERRKLRRAFEELSALDDRSLADIGISRSEIRYVLAHSPARGAPETPTPPATGKLRHAA